MEETVRIIVELDSELLELMKLEDNLRRALKRETPGTKDWHTAHGLLSKVTAQLDTLDTEIEDMRRRAVVAELVRCKGAAYAPFLAPKPLVKFTHIS